MTDERLIPDTETPPLHLAETAERALLHDRLAKALHSMRAVRIVDTDTDEFNAVKVLAEADTEELKTIPITQILSSGPESPESELTEREKKAAEIRAKRDAENRREQNMLDAARRLRSKRSPSGGPASRRSSDR